MNTDKEQFEECEETTIMFHFRQCDNTRECNENPKEYIVFKEEGHETIDELLEGSAQEGFELTGIIKFSRGIDGNPSPQHGSPYNLERGYWVD